jgi:hypothetical protein
VSARTLPEAAAELRMSPRRLRSIVVENGLYLMAPGSNRKRMTDEHIKALMILMRGAPCQSKPTCGKAKSTTFGERTSASC